VIFPFMRIHDGEILDRWNAVVEDGCGHEEDIYRGIESFVRESGVPDIRMERGTLATGFLAWVFGDRRDCLRVTNTLDADVETVVVCISVASYGSALTVNWWVLSKLGLWRWLVERTRYWVEEAKPPTPLVVEMDTFQKDILMKAFGTVLFTGLQLAVQEIMQGLGKDTSGLDSTSGFLI